MYRARGRLIGFRPLRVAGLDRCDRGGMLGRQAGRLTGRIQREHGGGGDGDGD
jgi:hypothetical protein